jgi:Domain of unknown function (DUF397)
MPHLTSSRTKADEAAVVGTHRVSSPRSSLNGSADIEWRKSSWSANNGACVEAAGLGGGRLAVRDSKDSANDAPILHFTSQQWRVFLRKVKDGRFDI